MFTWAPRQGTWRFSENKINCIPQDQSGHGLHSLKQIVSSVCFRQTLTFYQLEDVGGNTCTVRVPIGLVVLALSISLNQNLPLVYGWIYSSLYLLSLLSGSFCFGNIRMSAGLARPRLREPRHQSTFDDFQNSRSKHCWQRLLRRSA